MSVGRVCQREVDFANPTENVRIAAERLSKRGVGTLVVLDDDGVPVGILTDRDVVLRVVAARKDPDTTLVRDVMSPDPKTVIETTPIEDAVSLMRSGEFRRLPVVDSEQKLIGLLSLDDVLLLLAEEMTSIGQLLERESPRSTREDSKELQPENFRDSPP